MGAARTGIVIGIGNLDRGDDAAGRVVVRRLAAEARRADEAVRSHARSGASGRRPTARLRPTFVESEGEAAALLAALADAGAAILVDACASGAAPGTVHRFDAAAAALPARRFGVSTHAFGLAETLELARALDQLPPRCIVYAVEGQSFAAGGHISPAVAAGIEAAEAWISAEIRHAATVASRGTANRRHSIGAP